jgi:hypothetical protein
VFGFSFFDFGQRYHTCGQFTGSQAPFAVEVDAASILAALLTNDPLPESLHRDGDWFQAGGESDKIQGHKVMLDASTGTTASFAAPESWSALHGSLVLSPVS